ncbi:MAG: VWA domain-containing protein [Hyphomicrobiaceae bacterium]
MSPSEPAPAEASPTAVRLEANLIVASADGGRLADNVMHFARLLRASGLAVGPADTVRAMEAALAVGIESPRRLYWALHATLVRRRQDREIFNQAFVAFWKDPGFLEQMLSLMLPRSPADAAPAEPAMNRRLAESLFRPPAERPDARAEDHIEIDMAGTHSVLEVSRTKDFEQMSAAELAAARRAIARLRLPAELVRTRRLRGGLKRERIDLRRIVREMAAKGPDHLLLHYRERRWRRAPLVVLCDVSGSMETYARVLLHFLHALANDRDRVSTFLFGTGLSNVTRAFADRDPDVAVARVTAEVTDFSGGTRIATALDAFNRQWARRVLGQNAVVLLITDGLDRDAGEGLDTAARRLAACSRRLVWLNPLLRYDRYEPIAAGARVLARHAHEMRACHNLASLADLVRALDA